MDVDATSNGIHKDTSMSENSVKYSADYTLNGLSNGLTNSDVHHHHKHKHKDKDKDKHHKHKDRDGHSSSKDKHRDRSDKEEKKDKEHKRDKEFKDKEKIRRDKETEHRDKEKESRDKRREDRDKNKDNGTGGDGSSKAKEGASSSGKSSSVEKQKEKRDHDRSSKEREKDKHKDKKDKHQSSSSSGDKSSKSSKHRSSSKDGEKRSSKEKERSKDKQKHHDKDKKASGAVKTELFDMKTEPRDATDNLNAAKNEPFSPNKAVSDAPQIDFKPVKVEVQNMASSSFSKVKQEEMSEDGGDFSEAPESSYDDSEMKMEPESEEEEVAPKRSAISKAKKRLLQDDSDGEDEKMSSKKKKDDKKKSSMSGGKKRKKDYSEEEYASEEDYKPVKKKNQKVEEKKIKKEVKKEPKSEPAETPTKRKKKDEEEHEVWKWWEEEKKDDGVKWKFLEHKGPMFAPPYEPLPHSVKFYYDGKEMRLSEGAEEVATFYAKMLEHEYTTKDSFNKNFFKDWRKVMTSKEKEIITDLRKCDFRKMHAYFVQKTEERKAMSKEEKKKIKEENEKIAAEYGVCIIDGHKEKIGNFRIEPPGLFRGRGEHPKMGMLKRRVMPEDIIINCSKDSNVPKPPEGHRWKEVRHDNTVTWLASWTENVQGQVKYVMLNPSSKLKGEKDWQKYETARKLAKFVDRIRAQYREDWKSKEMRVRQRAVALYFIDRLALRAGNEKDEDQADTVGCCSLRVEHIQLHEEKDGKQFVVVFDFLGKDSIRYYNEVPVEKRVFKNLQLFCEHKKGSDDLFDRLNTAVLNKHLNELMEGLTAKVFRTYNASYTLQNQLNELTDPNASEPEKVLQYNRANRAVAILCNHQRSIPKSHEKSMGNLKQKIEAKREQVEAASRQYKDAKREAKSGGSKMLLDKKKKALDRLKQQLVKLEVQETDKEENKTIALGTSKLNYLDPRISVAWCKKHGVAIEKVYNKTQRMKFRWAIDMAGPDYVF